VAVAVQAASGADVGILSLAREEDALYVTLGGVERSARVALAARGPGGQTARAEREVTLSGGDAARAAWTAAEGFPAGAIEASARLLATDDLPTNDRAFAALSPAPPRRVGVVGDPGPDVLRALLEPNPLGAVTRNAVEQRGDHLRGGQPHIVVGLVDHQLLHHQLVAGNTRHPVGECGDAIVELVL